MDKDQIVEQIAEKVGISKEQADQVIQFLMDNKDEILKFLGSKAVKDKLPGGLGGLLGS